MTVEYSIRLGEQLVETYVKEDIPYAVQFELISKCNLKCRHCFMVNANGIELSSEEIMDIIEIYLQLLQVPAGMLNGEGIPKIKKKKKSR